MQTRTAWMPRSCLGLALIAAIGAACNSGDEPPAGRPPAATSASRSPGIVLVEDGQWTMQAKNMEGWRYSGLTAIDTATVANLREAWSFSTGTLRGHEGTPLVIGATMYLVTPFPNIAYALDLAAPVQPTLKWKYQPNPSPRAVGKACCDVVNRGWAYADGKLVYNLLDAHTVAVDAETGKKLWRVRMDDVERGVSDVRWAARRSVSIGSRGS